MTPFTSAQIRDAFTLGLVLEFRITDGPRVVGDRWTIVEADSEGVVMTSTPLDAAGEPTGPAQRGAKTPWDKLRDHALLPESATIEDVELVTPAGTFQCSHRTVENGPITKEFWFSVDHPGPPVRMTVSANGEQQFEMLLVSRHVE